MIPPFRSALEVKQGRLVFAASILYLAASAFGVLKVPGLELTWANLAFVLLGIAWLCSSQGTDFRPFFFLAVATALDLLFRTYQFRLEDIGYTANIGKLAVFSLVVQLLARLDSSRRSSLAVWFGVFALLSEAFALVYPTLREELYNSQPVLFDADGSQAGLIAFYRPTGLIGDPNYFAVPLVLMAMALFSERNYFWFGVAALLVAVTGSRSALVALFVPIAAMQLFRARTSLSRFSLYLLCYAAVTFLAFALNAELRGDTSESNTERAMLLRQGLENVMSLSFLQASYGQALILGIQGDLLVVHNTYLQTAVTSALLAAYLIYRTVAGMILSDNRLILAALVIEMFFLDVSSFSSFLFLFILYSQRGRSKRAIQVSHRSSASTAVEARTALFAPVVG